MNNKKTNPQSQYVVSYNKDDFYCNSIGVTTLTNIDSTINVDLPTFCKNPNSYHYYKNNNCSLYPTSQSKNIENTKCALLNQLCKNDIKFNEIKDIQTNHSASNSRYGDISSFYNTELIKSINLGVGILLLSSIIYKQY